MFENTSIFDCINSKKPFFTDALRDAKLISLPMAFVIWLATIQCATMTAETVLKGTQIWSQMPRRSLRQQIPAGLGWHHLQIQMVSSAACEFLWVTNVSLWILNVLCLLVSRRYGVAKRWDPSHVPFLLDKSIMHDFSAKFAPLVKRTISSKFRCETDLPIPFGYYNYVISEWVSNHKKWILKDLSNDHGYVPLGKLIQNLYIRLTTNETKSNTFFRGTW